MNEPTSYPADSTSQEGFQGTGGYCSFWEEFWTCQIGTEHRTKYGHSPRAPKCLCLRGDITFSLGTSDINNGPVSGCSRKQVPMCLGKHFGKCWGSTPSTQWSPPGKVRRYSCINCGIGKVPSLLKSSNLETLTKLSCNCQQTTDNVLKPVMDRAPARLPQALGGNTGITRVLLKWRLYFSTSGVGSESLFLWQIPRWPCAAGAEPHFSCKLVKGTWVRKDWCAKSEFCNLYSSCLCLHPT